MGPAPASTVLTAEQLPVSFAEVQTAEGSQYF